MRRSDHDVTNLVQTTAPAAVRDEIMRLFRGLYEDAPGRLLQRAFQDVERLYQGEDAEYYACDTSYHDIQHVLDVTLAMGRLMDGYQRSRRNGTPALPPELFVLGVLSALFHDFGYLRRRSDRRHRYGAEYTLTHVARGATYLRRYMRRQGTGRLAEIAAKLLHYTGYERRAESIRIGDTLLRRVGHMLGTADIIAQMADRCYLEKCRDRLYPEFVIGGVGQRSLISAQTHVLVASGEELVRQTPSFYHTALKRLDVQLARAYEYASFHFGGQNLYLEEMQKNVRYAKLLDGGDSSEMLRRSPPDTLSADVEPYPPEAAAR
ncbi:MAG: HD domain-containing protein [Bacteroidota bacterium]